jgi:hypothetical protein
MKKLIVVLMLVASPCFATTYWVDGTGGNDANDGLTEGNAKATTQDVLDDYTLVGGDRVICKNNISSAYVPDDDEGSAGNPLYIDDYNIYVNGMNQTLTDTTKLWNSTLSTSTGTNVINLNGVGSYTIFRGINILYNSSSDDVIISAGEGGIRFQQCRFIIGGVTLTGMYTSYNNTGVGFYGCWFISTAAGGSMPVCSIDMSQNVACSNDSVIKVINCTMSGRFEYQPSFHEGSDNRNRNVHMYNTIVYQTNSSSYWTLIGVNSPDCCSCTEWLLDYNIWKSTGTDRWIFNGGKTSFATFQSAAQGLDASNSVNSLNQDPDIKYISTTCVPNNPVACVDLGWGDEIGAYQTTESGGSSVQRIIIIQ